MYLFFKKSPTPDKCCSPLQPTGLAPNDTTKLYGQPLPKQQSNNDLMNSRQTTADVPYVFKVQTYIYLSILRPI